MPFNDQANPLNYPANNRNPFRRFRVDRAPTQQDFQNFIIGDFWIDTIENELYFLVDKKGIAIWILLSSITGPGVDTLTGNSGGAVPADGVENINVVGAVPFTVVGNPGTNTLTIENDGKLAEDYVTDSGTAQPNNDILNILGGTKISTTGAGNTITINGTAGAAETLTGNSGGAVGPDGSDNIDFVGATPLTVVGNPGSNTLTINTNGLLTEQYTTDNGIATPDAGNINVLGEGPITTSGTSSTITITSKPTVESFNLGFTLSGGTFSITAADGSALSSTNKGFVRVAKKSALGTFLYIPVTANQTFIDSTGASTIIGNLFGLTTGVVEAFDVPFFIYGVVNDAETEIAFMISRFPLTTISPVAAKIGQSGSAIASTQGSFFSLKSITATDFESNPVTRLGSFRMTMNVSDDWAVTAFATNDGIGEFQDDQKFNTSLGQFGAKAANFFIDNGGTAPTLNPAFSSLTYEIIDDRILIDFAANFTSTGVGAVALSFKSPVISNIGGIALSGNLLIHTAVIAPTFIGISTVTMSSNSIDFFMSNPTFIRKTLNTDALNTNGLQASALYPWQFS